MEKTLIAVGSAPCLYKDLEEALKLRPFAEIMLINGAMTAIESAEHCLAGHEEKAEFFAEARRKAFPNAPPWRLHAAAHPHFLKNNGIGNICPSVTDWHPIEKGIGATSASRAAKIAKYRLGFDEVILAGSPLDDSGYFPGEGKGIPQNRSCVRVGDPGLLKGFITPPHNGEYTTRPGEWMKAQETRIVRAYRTRFKELAEGEFKGWVFSISGYTREIFGYPPQRN
jgi:hypothetical protein